MNSQQTVNTFLEFFRERGHHPIPGQSLVPRPGDPVLFTTSGMHPLTPYLEGQPHPDGRRLADVQRCLRTTDLDEVGDRTHLTVFEMLGSWSLGDYPGEQSLRWGYELVTSGFGIDPGRLHATVFGGNDQVGPDTSLLEVWGELGVPVELTGTDNWWSNGPTGLCGTDSELFVWTGGTPPQGTPGSDGRWVELWNHVMLRYRRLDDGTLVPLPRPCVDTGMGLERLVTILQGQDSVFGCDLLRPWTGTVGRAVAGGGDVAAAGHRPPEVQRGRDRGRRDTVQHRPRLRAAAAGPPDADLPVARRPVPDAVRPAPGAGGRHAGSLRPAHRPRASHGCPAR